ncbi:hypothetical protein DUI87_29274 [Hirundo rustica rustica]|uniref:Uncharacterized protein n=1 Tax=Hirundo rustica rustica TaxID=333673 RepID=A0A3M0J6G6_HIRRU|nr:hypothetical protein DUI87_29274 [Hirundo rustica rustica]
MVVHGGTEIHLQPLDGDHVRAGCLKEAMTPWEVMTSLSGPTERSPHWSRVTAKDISQQCHTTWMVSRLETESGSRQSSHRQAYLEMEMSDTTVASYRAAGGALELSTSHRIEEEFTGDTMLGGAADPPRSVQPWEGPGQAGEMGREELAEVQQGQVQGPAPGEEQPQAPAQAGAHLRGGSSADKDLGVLMENELS